MKTIWVDCRPFDQKRITTALESGADGVVVAAGYTRRVHELGRITVIAEDGDIVIGKDVFEIVIRGKDDETRAAQLGRSATVIVEATDWMIIPLENLVAQSGRIFSAVKHPGELEAALGVLEKGVSGVVLKNFPVTEIAAAVAKVKSQGMKLSLEQLILDKIESCGMGDRVCVDTCTRMNVGDGMLIGNTSSGFLLVHSETEENPYVEPRPFRVNAGGLHAYCLSPNNQTNYLSELKAGSQVLLVSSSGETQVAAVGRVKIERRPLLYLEAHSPDSGAKVTAILQNAETIRLIGSGGKPVSVVNVKPGDTVLGHLCAAGRHFGMAVAETIIEK